MDNKKVIIDREKVLHILMLVAISIIATDVLIHLLGLYKANILYRIQELLYFFSAINSGIGTGLSLAWGTTKFRLVFFIIDTVFSAFVFCLLS